MIAEQIYEREGLQQMAYNIAQNYIIGLTPVFFDEWEKGVDAVTASDIALAATEFLQQDKSALGLLMPKKLEKK
jgi:predicted Zn-dependent peptidase